jgi:hypothetical protein
MQRKLFTNYMMVIVLTLISTSGSFTTETMVQASNASQGLAQQTTNSSSLDASYENVLKALRKTPIFIAGKGIFYISPFSPSTMINVDKISIRIDGNQAFITFLNPQTQLERTKVTFIGDFKDRILGFNVMLQNIKLEQDVYDPDSKQLRSSSKATVIAPHHGTCVYINEDVITNELGEFIRLGKFSGELQCFASFSGSNIFGFTEVKNLTINLNFSTKKRE